MTEHNREPFNFCNFGYRIQSFENSQSAQREYNKQNTASNYRHILPLFLVQYEAFIWFNLLYCAKSPTDFRGHFLLKEGLLVMWHTTNGRRD